jgi:hypothetical protein
VIVFLRNRAILPAYWTTLFSSLRGRSSGEVLLIGGLKPESREQLCSSQSYSNKSQ